MNRGSVSGFRRLGCMPPASMRPRFMNRGSVPDAEDGLTNARASMRPRFMNRGSRGERLQLAVGVPGFNEAPIHESGKC